MGEYGLSTLNAPKLQPKGSELRNFRSAKNDAPSGKFHPSLHVLSCRPNAGVVSVIVENDLQAMYVKCVCETRRIFFLNLGPVVMFANIF